MLAIVRSGKRERNQLSCPEPAIIWAGSKAEENEYRGFASKEECVAYMFDLLDRLYISKGRDTIDEIGHVYCATGGWIPQVKSIMHELVEECNG